MEQPCYKCGQLVEQGRPFCPHCAAPQIRVVLAETVPALRLTDADASPGQGTLPASQTAPVFAVPIRWSQTAQPCAIAALIASLAMVLKLMVPLVAAIGAGFIAVALYRRRNPGALLNARSGTRIGALCGLFCAAMTSVLASLRIAIMHEGNEVRDALLEGIRQSAARYPDPQVQPTLDFLRSPAGLALMLAAFTLFIFLVFFLLGAIGGAFAGAVLGRQGRG